MPVGYCHFACFYCLRLKIDKSFWKEHCCHLPVIWYSKNLTKQKLLITTNLELFKFILVDNTKALSKTYLRHNSLDSSLL